jgi:F-type H+-transporting ATPase subunit d
VQSAEKTSKKIKAELIELSTLLKDIETARPIDQLTVSIILSFLLISCCLYTLRLIYNVFINVDIYERMQVEDVAAAYPEIDSIVEKMAKRGQWNVPGYYEKFGEYYLGF